LIIENQIIKMLSLAPSFMLEKNNEELENDVMNNEQRIDNRKLNHQDVITSSVIYAREIIENLKTI